MVRGKRRLDYVLLIVTLALVGIGIVMVYSTSAIIAADRFGDPYFFLKRQALFSVIGVRKSLYVTVSAISVCKETFIAPDLEFQ